MRSSNLWKLQPFESAVVKKWCCRLFVCGAALGLFALAAGAATSDRFQWDRPVAANGITNAHSGGGNLVPLY